MKKLLTLFAVLFVYSSSFAVVNVAIEQHQLQGSFENLDPMVQNMDMEDFISLTPKKYRQMTGKKMGFKKTLQLKAAQRVIKKVKAENLDAEANANITKPVYVIAAIFGLGWLAMGLIDDWSGNNWWINLLLVAVPIILLGSFIFISLGALGWLAGLLHALIMVMDDYF